MIIPTNLESYRNHNICQIKGAACSSGEEILNRTEQYSLTDFYLHLLQIK